MKIKIKEIEPFVVSTYSLVHKLRGRVGLQEVIEMNLKKRPQDVHLLDNPLYLAEILRRIRIKIQKEEVKPIPNGDVRFFKQQRRRVHQIK